MNDFSSQLNYYRPSGESSLFGMLMVIFLGTLAGGVLGFLYVCAGRCVPLWPYSNVPLLLLFAVSLGWFLSFCVRLFKIQDAAVAGVAGFVVFIIVYLYLWLLYPAALGSFGISSLQKTPTFRWDWKMFQYRVMDSLLNPEDVYRQIRFFYDHGAMWNFSGRVSAVNKPSLDGSLLALLWALEALVLCCCVVVLPTRQAKAPFSEETGKWLRARKMPRPVAYIQSKEQFESAFVRGDHTALTTPLTSDVTQADGFEYSEYAIVTLYPDYHAPCVSVSNFYAGKSTRIVAPLKISPELVRSIEAALQGNRGGYDNAR